MLSGQRPWVSYVGAPVSSSVYGDGNSVSLVKLLLSLNEEIHRKHLLQALAHGCLMYIR